MKKIIGFLIFFLSMVTTWTAQDNSKKFTGNISIKIIANKYKIHLNDTLQIDISLTITGDINKLDIFEPPIPEVTNLKIIGSGSSNTVFVDKLVKKYTYYLLPTSIGMSYIEPIKTGYKDKTTEQTYHLATKRLSIEVMEPIAKKEGSYAFIIILIFIIIVIGIIVFFLIKRKTKKTEFNKLEENTKTYKEISLDDIENIKISKISNKAKVEKISNIVLRYLKTELNLPVGITANQVVENLKNMKINNITEIQNFFDKCDLIKFSGSEVSINQLNEILSIAKEILNFEFTKNTLEVTDDVRRD